MDFLLSKVTQHAMNYAIRSGVTITASYAFKQSSRLLKNAPKSNDRDELITLQERLQSKIRIISPAIDMIELIAARGNTSLESAVSLTKELRWQIQSLGHRLADAATSQESARRLGTNAKGKAQNELDIKLIIVDIKKLLERIEDAVPLINLAITTSGASLSTNLPSTVSPSRLLQASTFLTHGDTQYCTRPDQAVQIGPIFTLSVYMLFAGHVRPQDEEGIRETTWKEVMHKARVKLRRVPMHLIIDARASTLTDSCQSSIRAEARSDEFAYQLMVIEDLEDDRVHDFGDDEPQPGPFDDVALAGVREIFPIHQVSKIFYADTGKVLNIGSEGETNSPVLLLKRDLDAIPPRGIMVRRDTEDDDEGVDIANRIEGKVETPLDSEEPQSELDPWHLDPGLDPQWLALEVYNEAEASDDDSETDSSLPSERHVSHSASVEPQLSTQMARLSVDDAMPQPESPSPNRQSQLLIKSSPNVVGTEAPPWATSSIRTSLSLLELLLRLTSLQQFQQQSHLSITDELLNFFLEESATTGAGGDEEHRQRLRADARRRVGWDPYDESPLKRRGEDYQYRTTRSPHSPHWDTNGYEHNDNRFSPTGKQTRPLTDLSATQSPLPSSPAGMQTRSMTGLSECPSPSPSPSIRDRKQWLQRREEKKGSPLRPQTGVSDEGLGTSPGNEESKEDQR